MKIVTMVDQLYVSYRPGSDLARIPLLMIHGAGMAGAEFESTPDGRPGMAELFQRDGWPVYVVDQPARGRSRYHADYHGPLTHYTAELMERIFTATAQSNRWPQHEQVKGECHGDL